MSTEQHSKICDAEHLNSLATRSVRHMATDPRTLAALERAQYILAEVRQASYFLTDPDCPENLKKLARERLEQALINAK